MGFTLPKLVKRKVGKYLRIFLTTIIQAFVRSFAII